MTDPYSIPSISTYYSSIPFRSKLEAQTALFFDLLGLEWKYELRQFDFGYVEIDGKRERILYTPDFYMSQLNRWIEIKGPEPYSLAVIKCGLLAKSTRELVQIWSGSIGREKIYSYWWTKDRGLKCWKTHWLDERIMEISKFKRQDELDRVLWKISKHRFKKVEE